MHTTHDEDERHLQEYVALHRGPTLQVKTKRVSSWNGRASRCTRAQHIMTEKVENMMNLISRTVYPNRQTCKSLL